MSSAKGLGRVSNAKLVRLHDVLTDAKKRFGSRDKLIASIVEISKRTKDKGFASKLAAYPLPQLLDLHASTERASKRTEAAAKAKPARPRRPARPARRLLPSPRLLLPKPRPELSSARAG